MRNSTERNTKTIAMSEDAWRELSECVLRRFESEIPAQVVYHDVRHTRDVINSVERLARAERVSREDRVLLRLAALFHDAGFLLRVDASEEDSVLMARRMLAERELGGMQMCSVTVFT